MPNSLSQSNTMRAMRLREWGGNFELVQAAMPTPGPRQVLIAVHSVGIGVTNELARRGVLGGSLPRIGGHEFAGVITALGVDVRGWSIGERVVASFYLLCGECRWCASGRESLCERMGGYLGIDADGAFADAIAVDASALVAIPDGVALGEAGIASDAIATAYHAVVARGRVRPGDRVGVVGAGGGLGIHVLQVARAVGAEVLAVEIDTAKANSIETEGLADILVRESIPDDLAGTADVVIDTHGGSSSLAAAQRLLGRAGRLVVLGHVPGTNLPLDTESLLLEEREVLGTRYANRAEIAATLELVRRGAVRSIIGHTYPLARINEALADAVSGRFPGRLRIDVAEGGLR
jgi:D-arabinose 1-dehydrogenase-like Zn-dependent alcohol dehydrogenase